MRPIALVLASLFLALPPAPAATLEKLSWDDLISKSTSIVRGRVNGSSAAYRGAVIYTSFKIQVLERLKGPQQSTLEVLVPGGTVNGTRQSVSGATALVEGNEYVLFVWTAASGRSYVMGLTQGAFGLSEDAAGERIASRKASGETMLERGTLRVIPDETVNMRLRDLRALVTARLAGEAGK
jgi:hypothetical protein